MNYIKENKIKLIILCIGLTMQGFGLSFLILLNLGTDPCSSFTLGLVNYVPLSFGTCQLLCHLVTFVIVLFLDRKKIWIGTIGNMVFLGYIADFFIWIWNKIFPVISEVSLLVRCILLVPVMIIFIIGASLYMNAGLGMSPYDALPFIISDHVKKIPFKIIRIGWDFAFTFVGFLLGGAVGLLTVLCVFFLGPTISYVNKKLSIFLQKEET